MHAIAGKAICFGEALRPEFKEYAQLVVDNAGTLADVLTAGVRRIARFLAPRKRSFYPGDAIPGASAPCPVSAGSSSSCPASGWG